MQWCRRLGVVLGEASSSLCERVCVEKLGAVHWRCSLSFLIRERGAFSGALGFCGSLGGEEL